MACMSYIIFQTSAQYRYHMLDVRLDDQSMDIRISLGAIRFQQIGTRLGSGLVCEIYFLTGFKRTRTTSLNLLYYVYVYYLTTFNAVFNDLMWGNDALVT